MAVSSPRDIQLGDVGSCLGPELLSIGGWTRLTGPVLVVGVEVGGSGDWPGNGEHRPGHWTEAGLGRPMQLAGTKCISASVKGQSTSQLGESGPGASNSL